MAHNIASIRAFVLQAPPGQLQEVLKSLHTVCHGSDAFFSAIPDLSLEYTMRHCCPLTIAPEATADTTATTSTICCKQNHFVSRVKKLSKAFGVSGDDAAAEFLSYFNSSDAPFERHDFVFIDYQLGLYFEIDPVEGRVVRTMPFMEAAGDMVAALQQPSVAPLPQLHRYLVRDVAKYVETSFGGDAWWQQGQQHMLIGQEGKRGGRQKESRINSASHVAVESETSLVVVIGSERYVPGSRWAARWKSMFAVQLDDGGVVVQGEARIDGHYFEDSNVHVNVDETMEPVHIEPSDDAKRVAKAICAAIRNAEANLQEKLERSSKEVSESALKGLRRRLPVTKQPFDFHKAMLQLPELDGDQ